MSAALKLPEVEAKGLSFVDDAQYREEDDHGTGMMFFRPRYYDPRNGRFTRLDPFSGTMASPLTLHKYAYVHGNPISGIDPTGLFSLAEVQSALGIGLRIATFGFRIASAAQRGAQAVDTAISLYQFFFGGGIHKVRQAAEQIFRQWRNVPTNSGTASLLRQDFWESAISVLASNSSKIVARVTAQHGSNIVKLYASRSRKPITWVIFMPTPDDGQRSAKDLAIPNPTFRVPFPGLKIGGVPVVLQFGGGGGSNRGRVFGLGIGRLGKRVHTQQLFRMDYHIPHGKGKKDAYYWTASSTRHRFHFQIQR